MALVKVVDPSQFGALMKDSGVVLTYDTDDVESLSFSSPRDVIDMTRPEDTAKRRKLGQAHLNLTIDFKPGKQARWISKEELNNE